MIIEPGDPDIESVFNRIDNGIYDLQPDFQRDLVWNTEKQQKLIDSLLRGWHIPPIHLVKIEDKESFEVLDGKQRLFSIFNFIKDKFSYNAKFLPGAKELIHLHGKRFSQFPDPIKRKFMFTKIRIFEVKDVKMNEATELFLRLNQGVVVTSSEKRNSIYGPVKNFLRKDILSNFKDVFNENTLGFGNHRMAYQDAIDKIFFLENKGNLENKPGSRALEDMYFIKNINDSVKERFIENLNVMRKVLPHFKYRLTKSTLMTYYWFLRELRVQNKIDYEIVSKFINAFEQWREKQRTLFESNKEVSPAFLSFETYLSEGWLDPISLKGRHDIIIGIYKEFIEEGTSNEKGRV